MKKNKNTWERVFELGKYTIRVTNSSFIVYNGYNPFITLEWS